MCDQKLDHFVIGLYGQRSAPNNGHTVSALRFQRGFRAVFSFSAPPIHKYKIGGEKEKDRNLYSFSLIHPQLQHKDIRTKAEDEYKSKRMRTAHKFL